MVAVAEPHLNQSGTATSALTVPERQQAKADENLVYMKRGCRKNSANPRSKGQMGTAKNKKQEMNLRNEEEELDEEIWSHLSKDLQDRIFCMLPATSMARLRCVCRRWNAGVKNRLWNENKPRERAWFLLSTRGPVILAYDPSTELWIGLPRPISSMNASVISVAGPLVCLGNQVSECRVLSVCNPLARLQKQLTPMLKVSLIHKASIFVDLLESYYRVLVCGEAGHCLRHPYDYSLHTELYDSSCGSWQLCGRPPGDAKFGSDPGVWVGSKFFCITELPYGMLCFDLEKREWNEVEVEMPKSVWCPSLLQCDGRLYMIGRISGGSSVVIWAFAEKESEWVETIWLPENIAQRLTSPIEFYAPFVSAGNGAEIYITTHRNPNVLTCNLSSKSWRWLQTDPLFPEKRDFHLLGFAFRPRFDLCP